MVRKLIKLIIRINKRKCPKIEFQKKICFNDEFYFDYFFQWLDHQTMEEWVREKHR
jgi:hypothetical protein